MGIEQRLGDWHDLFGKKHDEVQQAFKQVTRAIGGEEMAEPKVVSGSTVAKQLQIDFGDRFAEIAWKETDRAIVGILKGLAILGLDESQVNVVMSSIGRYAECIAGHAGEE